jgi:hypothetical protein
MGPVLIFVGPISHLSGSKTFFFISQKGNFVHSHCLVSSSSLEPRAAPGSGGGGTQVGGPAPTSAAAVAAASRPGRPRLRRPDQGRPRATASKLRLPAAATAPRSAVRLLHRRRLRAQVGLARRRPSCGGGGGFGYGALVGGGFARRKVAAAAAATRPGRRRLRRPGQRRVRSTAAPRSLAVSRDGP